MSASPTFYRADQESEWLAHRRRRLTASEFGAVFGYSQWSDAATVQAIKRGHLENSGIDPERARIGHDAEEFVAQQFLSRHTEWGTSAGTLGQAVYEDAESVLSVTPDRAVYWKDDIARRVYTEDVLCGLECKTVATQEKPWTWEEPYPAYMLQCIVGLICTGWSEWWLACCWGFAPGDYREWCITRESVADMIPGIRSRANAWWQTHIVEGVDVEPTGKNAVKILAARPKEQPNLVRPNEEEMGWLEGLRQTMKFRRECSEAVDAYRITIAEALDARGVQGFQWDTDFGVESVRFDNKTLRTYFQKEQHGA